MASWKRHALLVIFPAFGFILAPGPAEAQAHILNAQIDPPHAIAHGGRTHENVRASALVSVIPDRARASATEPPWTLYFIYAVPADAQSIGGQGGIATSISHHVILRLDGVNTQIRREQWADSRECHPLSATLGWLSRIVSPGLDIDGITPRREPIGGPPWDLGLHPPTVTVWASAWTTHGSVQHHRVQESGGALGAWLLSTNRVLEACWQGQEPG